MCLNMSIDNHGKGQAIGATALKLNNENMIPVVATKTSVAEVTDINLFSRLVNSLNYSPKFFELLTQYLQSHFELYDFIKDCKPKGEQMEYLFKKAFIKSGLVCEMTSPHKIGTDLILNLLNDTCKISLKSGDDKITDIEVSSYRTTSIQGDNVEDTLNKKLAYCQTMLLEDAAIICSIPEFDEKTNKYSLNIYALDTSKINLLELDWISKSTKKGKINYHGTSKNNSSFSAKIMSSMSDQLWLSIPKEWFILIETINLIKK